MKDLDIQISEKVAEEASRKINSLNTKIKESKDIYISVLSDVLTDMKEQRKFLKRIVSFLCVVVILLVLGMFGLGIYNQHILHRVSLDNAEKVFEFINNSDFNSNVNMNTDNNSNAENITITK